MAQRAQVFIASSVEGLNVAYSVQQNLEHDADVTIWDQGIFELSKYTLDELAKAASQSDFAIFIFTPDDVTNLRGKKYATMRDNVLFEYGLFMGALDRSRTFLVHPRGITNLHIPSDLIGAKPATYSPTRADDRIRAALGPACNEIRGRIKQLGARGGVRQGSLERDYNRQVEAAGAIIDVIYPEFTSKPRINVSKVESTYTILANGDAEAVCYLEIRGGNRGPAHFWVTYIDADEESQQVSSISEIGLNVTDGDRKKKLEWLVIDNDVRSKKIAIFFPELQKDRMQSIRWGYRWPRLYGRLLEKDRADFWWSFRSASSRNRAHVKTTWEFKGLDINAVASGKWPKDGQLTSARSRTGIRWFYVNDREITDGTEHKIQFERKS